MKSKPVALFMADLGITKTHSRPHVSNDNPFSEAQFKTLKYRPEFPRCFGSLEHARMHCAAFFRWYNAEHHHVGIGLLTPHDVHHGLAQDRIARRADVLAAAYAAHPGVSSAVLLRRLHRPPPFGLTHPSPRWTQRRERKFFFGLSQIRCQVPDRWGRRRLDCGCPKWAARWA